MRPIISTIARAAAKAIRSRITQLAAPLIVRHRNGNVITAAIADGKLITVTAHLAVLGASDDTQHRYGSHAGKKIAAAHRARTGRAPLRIWTIASTGYPIHVYAYSPADPALAEGLRAYPRTAHLIAA
ncbi:hypothetical protein D5S18_24845 [Nocardia panacis]|uniref:Uncharacterized protein n=1 Tax=Nocardia panacis TaxID=2340916 RepID=A0A3A4K3V0_9NOCA|nr:hypothetical protein [Nocardia panacis]RJO71403.1 hypothetical protein D5S18_24845 [Nocardia panacis]